MFVISFFIVIAIVAHIFNMNSNAANSSENLSMDRNSSFIIASLFIVSIALEYFLSSYGWKVYLIALAIYIFIEIPVFVVLNNIRARRILETHASILQLCDIFGSKIVSNKEEIDFDNPPFVIEKEGKKIKKVTVEVSTIKLLDDIFVSDIAISMSKAFPYFEWIGSCDFEKRSIVIYGAPKPPNLAMFPGSDLRPAEWIPLGLSGEGEIGWNLDSGKDLGQSLYKYENNSYAKTVNSPKAPQSMVLGSTGGGKAIYKEQKVKVYR